MRNLNSSSERNSNHQDLSMSGGFETSVPGKWVLAGEHSVLRGFRAVGLPHPSYRLRLRFLPDPTFTDSSHRIMIEPSEVSHFVGDLLKSLEREVPIRLPSGTLQLESGIPEAAGLGSSAALSVALVSWLEKFAEEEISKKKLELARLLEDTFHGKSSGMDVAIVLKKEPILFSQDQGPSSLQVSHLPPFQFFDTGMRSPTSECVNTVSQWVLDHPEAGERMDRRMDQATVLGAEGLKEYSSALRDGEPASGQRASEALRKIASALNEAYACFESWGLIPPRIAQQVRELRERGAMGVKLTGAGRGGFLVAVQKTKGTRLD